MTDNEQLASIYQVNPVDNLAEELDPNYRPHPIKPPSPADDELDSGIAGPDGPDVDPDFSRPSQGLDSEDDPHFEQMPLPDEFLAEPLAVTSLEEYEQWDLLRQFPYSIGQALRMVFTISPDIDIEQRLQLLHCTKVYVAKALEYYDPTARPALFTTDGVIKGTQIGCFAASHAEAAKAWEHDAKVRKAFAAANPFIKALLTPCGSPLQNGSMFSGISALNLKSMLSFVEQQIKETAQQLPSHNIGD